MGYHLQVLVHRDRKPSPSRRDTGAQSTQAAGRSSDYCPPPGSSRPDPAPPMRPRADLSFAEAASDPFEDRCNGAASLGIP
jgi:hypothetical protein